MDLTWSDEDEQFQTLVRRFLDENLTADLRRTAARMTSVYADRETAMAWQAILHAQGWAAQSGPPPRNF